MGFRRVCRALGVQGLKGQADVVSGFVERTPCPNQSKHVFPRRRHCRHLQAVENMLHVNVCCQNEGVEA